jgi:uncharacterized protein (DUF433 family)/DNA-binding transcriptional MerR regulator
MTAAFGLGAYTLGEAGRLLNVPPSTIRHWLFGYSYSHHGPKTHQEALWNPQYGLDQEEPLLGFRDLLEARIVRGLRSHGLGMPTIRACLRLAREITDDDHPFSTRRFRTDGKRLFVESEGALIDLKLRQHVIKRIIEPSFVDLDFDAEAASRWWLNPRKKTIVLDPARSFGQPIVDSTGVSTARLLQAVDAEGSVDRVAQLYDLKPSVVRDALAFERQGNQKLAA